MSSIRETIAFAIALGAVAAVVLHCTGCTPSERQTAEQAAVKAAQAAVNVGYDVELVECKRRGKESGSFAVFDACERAASRRLCVEHPELREPWGRCKEVLP